jgi:5-methyltetrahydrofolate--homocysteine methyltransferase
MQKQYIVRNTFMRYTHRAEIKERRKKMSIEFSPTQWDRVKLAHEQWWNNTLERPLAFVYSEGRDPKRSAPNVPLLTQATCNDFSIPPTDLIDRLDYELSKRVFLGDSYPYVNLDVFGPGIVSGFCGAVLDNSTGRVWFHPSKKLEIEDIHLSYDPDNIWLRRVKEICHAGMERWQGQVLMGMPDLGGILDILANFIESQDLLIALYDAPEEVERLIGEIQDLWFRYYEEINSILQPNNPGYSDWSAIYSKRPSYILQSDLSYMISPDMFAQFVVPELKTACARLPRTIYHLDGIGQLSHLDQLLSIQDLDAIQWIPGDGQKDESNWPEVYTAIHAAGKKIQITGQFSSLNAVIGQIGTSKGIHFRAWGPASESEIQEELKKYN